MTAKSQKMHVYRWKSKNTVPVFIKWLLYCTKTINKCVWMEMNSHLKSFGRFFQVSPINLAIFFFKMSLILFPQ